MSDLLTDVVERNRRWFACPRHYFPEPPGGRRLGQLLPCKHCGVEARQHDVQTYVSGYVAAGGNHEDILPDW